MSSIKTLQGEEYAFITRGAREQIAVELDREYDRRLMAVRQRSPFGTKSHRSRPWSIIAGSPTSVDHERIAEMLVEFDSQTLGFVFELLLTEEARLGDLFESLGPTETAHIVNRLGLTGIAVVDGERVVATPQGTQFLIDLTRPLEGGQESEVA